MRPAKALSRIAQPDQRIALPDQCLQSAEPDVRPPRGALTGVHFDESRVSEPLRLEDDFLQFL